MMKKGLIILLSVLVLSCGVKNTEFLTYGGKMETAYEQLLTANELDSVLVKECVPTDMGKWKASVYKDFEDGSDMTEYLYIKSLGKNETIYRAERRGDKFKLSKRITKK